MDNCYSCKHNDMNPADLVRTKLDKNFHVLFSCPYTSHDKKNQEQKIDGDWLDTKCIIHYETMK